ncbi:hypothetical protein HN937_01500 [Candidatus Poribacteria bacterium]|nr:hypothetical protein [Candidatus Poribacteria bacterium]
MIATGDGARKRSEDVREWLGDAFRADYIHGAHDGGAVDVGDQRVVRTFRAGSSSRQGMLPRTTDLMEGRLGFRCANDMD